MTNNKYGLTASSIQKYGFKKALEVFEKYQHKCSFCKSSDYLAIHHIDGNGIHNKEKGLEVNDSLENLQLICRKCHGSIHAKKYWAEQAEIRGGYLWKNREKEYHKSRGEYQKAYRNKRRLEKKEKPTKTIKRNYMNKKERISFRPGDDLWEQLHKLANKRKIKLSDLLREILVQGLLEGKIKRRENEK